MIAVVAAFLIFLTLIAIGTPVFFGIFIGAGVGLYLVQGWSALWSFFSLSLHTVIAQYTFAVIPMFILVGTLAESGGLGVRAYQSFHKLVGHVSGGLLISTTLAAAAFGACSGSTVASAALFSKIALPELRKYRYSESLSLGAIATAGSLATLIPPSIMMVIFGILSNTSVGYLLIAGIVPGLLLTGLITVLIYVVAKMNPRMAPVRVEPVSVSERLMTLPRIWPLIAIFLIIIGSIWSGVVTASEAGALGVVVVLFWNFLIRVRVKSILGAFRDAAVTSCQIMILIVGGLMLSKVVAYSGLPADIINWITVNSMPLTSVWALTILMWLVLGMLIDSTSQLVLTVPFIFPVMTGLGADPLVIGIVAIVMIEVGVITPPVGFNCYVVSSIAGVDPAVAFKGIFPFFAVLLVVVVVLIAVPSLSTWLPNLAFG
ncbi:MAG: TRAP transporter large permease [Chloroflexi bacterium]|nr:TRAP transporter large permease [Chloroflexota bacterium]